MILKKKITLADMESVDAEIFRSLTWMLCVPSVLLDGHALHPHSENDVTDVIENTFTVEDERFGEVVTSEVRPLV
jgi:E3 ubiquitin-protein ligase NEDD4